MKSRQDKDKLVMELSEKVQELSKKVISLEAQLSAKRDKGLKSTDLEVIRLYIC